MGHRAGLWAPEYPELTFEVSEISFCFKDCNCIVSYIVNLFQRDSIFISEIGYGPVSGMSGYLEYFEETTRSGALVSHI